MVLHFIEIATKASIASGTKKTEKQSTEDDLWGATNAQSQFTNPVSRNNRQESVKRSKTPEQDQGWGDWNDGGAEGKHMYKISYLI